MDRTDSQDALQIRLQADFLRTYDAHADEIFRFCVLKVSNKDRAKDLTQESFMKYWQELRKGVVIDNPRAFLYRVARNLVIDWYRKKKDASLDERMEKGFDAQGSGAAEVTAPAQMREILEAVETLDEPSREAVLMRFVEGYSPQEIAKITGESANVISVRLNRAIAKIQKAMHI